VGILQVLPYQEVFLETSQYRKHSVSQSVGLQDVRKYQLEMGVMPMLSNIGSNENIS
jgi:hypothetical protein